MIFEFIYQKWLLENRGIISLICKNVVLKNFVGHCGIFKPGGIANGELETLSMNGTFINYTQWLTQLSTLPQSSGAATLLEIEL